MTYTRPLYKLIASAIDARLNCLATTPVNQFGLDLHTETLDQIDRNLLPSGSGLDCGVKIDRERSKSNRLVLTFSFHHMDEFGGYDGWTDHELIITPDLASDFDMRITGRDRNQIKEYLYDVFSAALRDIIDCDVSPDREVTYFSVSMRDAARQYQERVASGEIV